MAISNGLFLMVSAESREEWIGPPRLAVHDAFNIVKVAIGSVTADGRVILIPSESAQVPDFMQITMPVSIHDF